MKVKQGSSRKERRRIKGGRGGGKEKKEEEEVGVSPHCGARRGRREGKPFSAEVLFLS